MKQEKDPIFPHPVSLSFETKKVGNFPPIAGERERGDNERDNKEERERERKKRR